MSGLLHVGRTNRCRSLAADLTSRHFMRGWPPRLRFPVRSAGTDTKAGLQMWPDAEAVLRARGVQTAGAVSRRLDARLVREADLVLTATAELREEVLRLAPRSGSRTFTWVELAGLLDGVTPAELAGPTPVARLAEVVELAGRRRQALAEGEPARAGDLDVADPATLAPEFLEVALEQIARSLVPLFSLLSPSAD